jgi:hypothetical protein
MSICYFQSKEHYILYLFQNVFPPVKIIGDGHKLKRKLKLRIPEFDTEFILFFIDITFQEQNVRYLKNVCFGINMSSSSHAKYLDIVW